MKLLFSDLDGTILDFHTYSCEKSLPGISLCREHGIPLILVSSKTFDEMADIHCRLGLDAPFVFENGGGVAWKNSSCGSGSPYELQLSGLTCEVLRERLPLLRDAAGHALTPLPDMDWEKVADLTGLDETGARNALKRRTSIPFIIDQGNGLLYGKLPEVNSMLQGHGLQVIQGRRFFHFTSAGVDKGAAVKKIIARYGETSGNGEILTFAAGDSFNDMPMFDAVSRSFYVGDDDVAAVKSGTVHRTEARGPAGFTEAVRGIIAV
ncbi:MAG TPA: HAD-IIB family hydrolase, partial [Spirochaetota bacterium]|nr:HAD-IIB family hydrolase [Spirochaetota bacterium]